MSTDRAHNSRLYVRLSAVLVSDYTIHAQGRGETLTTFVRRALERTAAADRAADNAARVRAALSAQVFLPEFPDPESNPSTPVDSIESSQGALA